MKVNPKLLIILIFSLPLFACSADPVEVDERPNILLIVADDLGYSDLSFYGSEIPTPNLDQLASEGMLLTNFHTAQTCSPTRSMLFSGTDSHLAGLGVMGDPREDQLGQPGYETYLNFRVASLADLMSDAGYNTYMAGKWHLGLTEETSPAARGMKRSFAVLEGGAAHLGGMSMYGPNYQGSDVHRDSALYREDLELTSVGDEFYSTQEYTDRMIGFIETDKEDDKPFFAYLAYTAPHWPLQAPQESIAKFTGMYNEGYEELYQSRFERMGELGLLPAGAEQEGSNIFQPGWDLLSEQAQREEARRMEIYAAMVNDLDIYVGKLIDYLKSIGEFENTLIMFMSDNGAQAGRVEDVGSFSNWASICCDNSYENMGKSGSYLSYGVNWANAGAIPWRRHKATAFEGGIHVPAFVHYPQMITPGSRSNGFSTVMDLLPTFLALANTEHPGTTYRDQNVLPVKGKSLLPILSGAADSIHSDEEYTGWELYGHRSIRQGDWKIVWDAAEGLAAQWKLFNLSEDPSERNNLADINPEKLSAMIPLWDRYEEENGVIY